jgi:hypothetical protein
VSVNNIACGTEVEVQDESKALREQVISPALDILRRAAVISQGQQDSLVCYTKRLSEAKTDPRICLFELFASVTDAIDSNTAELEGLITDSETRDGERSMYLQGYLKGLQMVTEVLDRLLQTCDTDAVEGEETVEAVPKKAADTKKYSSPVVSFIKDTSNFRH